MIVLSWWRRRKERQRRERYERSWPYEPMPVQIERLEALPHPFLDWLEKALKEARYR